MKIRDFEQSVLDHMETRINDFDRMRPWAAYVDITNTFDLITGYEQSPGVQSLSHASSEAEVNNVRVVSSIICTLHKALIEFANVYMTILVHEAKNRPCDEFNIGHLVQASFATLFNTDVLHQAYCLYVYRNKVITHHEVPRNNGYLRGGDGTCRLWPFGHQPRMTPNEIQILSNLQQTYSSNSDVASETNPYELLNVLFYKIPFPLGNKVKGSDRDTINKFADKGGAVP